MGLFTHRLMYAASIQGLHTALRRAWIIVFHKAVVQALALKLKVDMLKCTHTQRQVNTTKILFSLRSYRE